MISWIVTIFILICGIVYKAYQDKNQLGGKIAWSKSIWLSYTIIAWFFLPPIFYFLDIGTLKSILIIISCSYWTRGLLELIMLFKWKNWKPIYGISHNIFTISLALFFFFYLKIELDRKGTILALSYLVSFILETYYAYFFHTNVGKDTQGDQAIWFANKEDPKFKFVLKVTTIGNIFVFSCLFYFLLNQ